jgi:NAD(P)-dependent dehydrogenase (short-subunit alcohol dehydrogenase family)
VHRDRKRKHTGLVLLSFFRLFIVSAAIFTLGLIENVSVDDWTRILDINVRGYALTAKHVAPLLKQQRSGSIIQFASISGFIAQPSCVPYGTTKGAIIQMTRNLALDLGPYNIRCNSISPGYIGMLLCLFFFSICEILFEI